MKPKLEKVLKAQGYYSEAIRNLFIEHGTDLENWPWHTKKQLDAINDERRSFPSVIACLTTRK